MVMAAAGTSDSSARNSSEKPRTRTFLSTMDSLSCEQNLHFCRETHRSHAATNGRIVTFLFSGVERIVRELLLKCNPFRTRILTTLFRCSSSGQRCWKQWSVVSSQDIMMVSHICLLLAMWVF